MAWVWVAGVHAWVDDAGPYLPGGSVKPKCPHHSLFAGDVNEIDYVVVPTGTATSTFAWSQARYDSYSFIYDDGSGSVDAFSCDATYEDLSVSGGSYRLFLVVYTDGGSSSAPLFSALDVTPSTYASGGGAANPVPPGNDDFANAITLPSTVSGSFDGPANLEWAGLEAEESGGQYPYGGNTVWYKFVPPRDGDYTFTCQDVGSPSGFAPAGWIYAYRESDHPGTHPASNGETWSQNNVGGSRDVMLIDGAVAGETIWLQLDLAEHYAPHYTWAGPPSANDNFANRTNLGVVSASVDVPFDLAASTLESGEQHTSGMAGSVWYQVQVDTDRLVLFDVPAGVEVRLYRGTATLAGMLYRNVSNDAVRRAFNMGAAFTYWVKLQSATATEAGTMHVRPFAWTDYLPRPTVLRYLGGEFSTHMQFDYTVGEAPIGGYPSLAAAWADSLGGPHVSGNKVQYPNGNLNGSTSGPSWFGISAGKVDGNYYTGYVEAVYAIDFNDWLEPDVWPADPEDFGYEQPYYGEDPTTFESIQYEAGDAEVGSGMGRLFAGALPNSGQSDGAPPGHSVDVYVRRYTPTLDPTSTVPDWQTPDITGLQKAFTINDSPGTYGTVTDELDIEWDVVADLEGGTKVSYLLLPDPATPDDPGGGNGGSYSLQTKSARVFPAAPILYPRFKIYAPLPAAAPTAVVPLRQVGRPHSTRQYPRGQVNPTRQVGQIP